MSLAPLNPIQMLPARDRVAAALPGSYFKPPVCRGRRIDPEGHRRPAGRVVYADPRGIPDAGAGRG